MERIIDAKFRTYSSEQMKQLFGGGQMKTEITGGAWYVLNWCDEGKTEWNHREFRTVSTTSEKVKGEWIIRSYGQDANGGSWNDIEDGTRETKPCGVAAGTRSTDMAREMMSLSQSNILQQASIAMLAQANASPQSVLSLLC